MTKANDLISGGLVAVVGHMYQSGVVHALPWIVAMTCVVFADLCTGMRKVWLMGEEQLRWSKGIRATMSKLITYYAFVVGAVMVNVASGELYDIDKWACLMVCAVEGLSIIGNILKPHGITISISGILHAIGGKFNVDLDNVVCENKTKVKRKTKKTADE